MDKRFYWKSTLLIIFILVLVGVAGYFLVRNYNKSEKSSNTSKTKTSTSTTVDTPVATNAPETINNQDEVSFIAVGDISFSRGVERVVKYQKDINFPFLKTKTILENADFTYGNLETPITPGEEIPDGSMVFRSNPGTEQALKWAGFDILNLANNHSYNFDAQGLEDTFKYLESVDIKYVGAGSNSKEAYEPIFFSKNNINFAMLSYEAMDIVPAEYEATPEKSGITFMRIDKMQDAVRKAKETADFVIVAMHAGEEYVPLGNDLQTNFAHAAIDAGAELVIGDHPHVVQNAEIYNNKIIFYNLGNFVMDQMWSDDTRRALIFKGNFTKEGLEHFELFPVVIEHYSQPTPVNGNVADQIIQRLLLPVKKEYRVSYDTESEHYQKNSVYIYEMNKVITQDFVLNNGEAKIFSEDKVIWESPTDWYVSQIVKAPSLNDGRNLINMSVWKPGNYGNSMPIWETDNDPSVKNHLFVYEIKNNELTPVWQSSNLPVPNCKINFYDIENDGKYELVAYEGKYENNYDCTTSHVAVFRWNQWGFYNEWREAIN